MPGMFSDLIAEGRAAPPGPNNNGPNALLPRLATAMERLAAELEFEGLTWPERDDHREARAVAWDGALQLLRDWVALGLGTQLEADTQVFITANENIV